MAKNQKQNKVNETAQDSQETAQAQPKVKKAKPVRLYQWSGKKPQDPKGQVVTVLAALESIGDSPAELAQVVAKVKEIAPTYKTITPLEDSVKFHLHQLARKNFVIEVNQAPAESQAA
jgi:hypothetical protein